MQRLGLWTDGICITADAAVLVNVLQSIDSRAMWNRVIVGIARATLVFCVIGFL